MSDVSQGPGWWLASDGRWYPPQAQPGPVLRPSSPKKVYQQWWFWVLVVLALVLGSCMAQSVGIFDVIKQANTTQHTVVYSVTGTGTADIIYHSFQNGKGGSSQVTGATLPWTTTVTGSGIFTIYSVNATLVTGTSISCTLTVDGAVVTSLSATGQHASVDCAGNNS